MFVEVHTEGIATFMRAAATDNDVEDVRAMYVYTKWEPKNHKELWR